MTLDTGQVYSLKWTAKQENVRPMEEAGVDANADYEPAAGSGDERRPALEEKTVQRARVSTVREMMAWHRFKKAKSLGFLPLSGS
jgi:hypothetical protein